jgi:hypothetical protein
MSAPESPGQVLPPWVESPFRLWSSLDMNKFSAGIFVNIGSSLHWFSTLAEIGQWDDSMRDTARRFGISISNDLREIGCDVAAQSSLRFSNDISCLGSKYRPLTDLKPRAEELQNVIYDEMRRHLFFWVPPDKARYYSLPDRVEDWDDAERVLHNLIAQRFNKALNELVEARVSYALDRNTGCVFHLMRACESGIKALYCTLNIAAPKLSDSWGNLLRPMDEQLALPVNKRHGDWATHPEFFDHATNDVRAIKRAWRDPTMHIESDYDQSGALKAMGAVTSFFTHLAERIDQDGKFYTP